MTWLSKILRYIRGPYDRWQAERRYRKRIAELRKRDPFIYH